MTHASLPVPEAFDALPVKEQILHVESLWERVAARPDAIPVNESRLRVVESRLREYLEDPSIARPADPFFERLAAKLRARG